MARLTGMLAKGEVRASSPGLKSRPRRNTVEKKRVMTKRLRSAFVQPPREPAQTW